MIAWFLIVTVLVHGEWIDALPIPYPTEAACKAQLTSPNIHFAFTDGVEYQVDGLKAHCEPDEWRPA